MRAQGDQLLQLIQEESKKGERRYGELLGLVREERALNNGRFTQLATGLMDVKSEVRDSRIDLNAKIDRFHASLSADINAFGEELYEAKCDVSQLKKKLLS